MASSSVLPKLITNNGNSAETWKQWLNSFQIYLIATEVSKKEEKIQVAQLLHFAGPEAQKIYSTFKLTDEEKDNLKAVIEKFDQHFSPRQNITFLRYKFFTTKQTEGMSLDEYVTELKKQAQACNFDTLHDEMIKLIFICGTNNEEIRRRLLQEDDASLEKAIKLATIIEQSKNEASKISLANNQPQKGDVDRVTTSRGRPESPGPRAWRSRSKSRGPRPQAGGRYPSGAASRHRSPSSTQGRSNNFIHHCWRCGLSHNYNQCPAYQKTCGKCKQLNHFANMCRNKKTVNSISSHNTFQNDCTLFVGTINNDLFLKVQSQSTWVTDLKINNKNISLKLDTGAMANVLSIKHFLDLKLPYSLIQPTNVTLKSYTGDMLPLLGQCELECEYLNKTYKLTFYVINDLNDALLGLKSCIDLNLLTHNTVPQPSNSKIIPVSSLGLVQKYEHISKRYVDVFSGIGCINPPYHIQLKENAQSVISPIRRVPFALMDKLKKTLADLEKQRIIEKVSGPSDWVHPLVLVKKSDDSLRVCLDPLHLNQAMKREHCKLLTLEEITSKLQDAKYFTKLDANQAFYQIPLDNHSSNLCTVGTPFGRYKFLRLPYGVKCAPEVFNERFRQIFDIENVAVYIDDIIIWGTSKEHDKILEKTLEIARRNNIKFNLAKCKFGVAELKFMGHIINADGVSIEPDRVKAIRSFPDPICKKDVQRLLGVINYLSKYIPNFAEQSKPLRELLKKETHFTWEPHHKTAFENIKNCLINSPVLRFFNPNKEIVVSVDASQNGLGACLMQDGQPIYYASKALTSSQSHQAQITKELLAIWFGLSKFHDYVFARHVTVETDHKPLLALMKKTLNAAPARLQRILLSLQKYQFTLVYKRGKDLIIADTLSRACEPSTASNELDIVDQVCVVSEPHISDEILGKIKAETEKDIELNNLKTVILNGWPKVNKTLNNLVRPYMRYKSELTFEQGIIYKGNSCVIPVTLRKLVLEKIHYSHLGYNKCVKLAQESVFWPTIKNEIKQMIDNCAVCQKYAPSQRSEPLKSHVWLVVIYLNGEEYIF